MSALVLLIKNMVCNRCILAVENILTSESISFQKITIGQVELTNELTQPHKIQMVSRLREIGFDLIDNRSTALIERVKQLVVSKARNDLNTLEPKVKLSLYLSANVNHEYTYISSLFSSVEGRTIENYFIEHRIEKVKELGDIQLLPHYQNLNLNLMTLNLLLPLYNALRGISPLLL